jgi:hypothetical protein
LLIRGTICIAHIPKELTVRLAEFGMPGVPIINRALAGSSEKGSKLDN